MLTPSVLDHADDLVDVFGEEFAGAMAAHQNAYSDPVTLKDTTLRLCRAVKHDPNIVPRLEQLSASSGVSPAFAGFLQTMENARNKLSRRLRTTVEEETSVKENFQQVLAREKKAGKERLALENQLKVESRERRRQVSHAEEAETRIREELATIMNNSAAHAENLRVDATEKSVEENAMFEERKGALTAQLAKLQAQLADIQKEHKEEEAAMRKKMSDNEKKLAGNLADYDAEMGVIEKQLQEEKGLYDAAKKQLTEYETHYNALRKEKEEAEAIKREREEAKRKEDEMNKMLDDAALSIQKAWKTHKEATQKPAPKGKKK